jgi:hypothetical protein
MYGMFSKRKTNLRLSFFQIKKETKNQGSIKMSFNPIKKPSRAGMMAAELFYHLL